MTIADEKKHLKMYIWRVLDSCGVIKDRFKGPGSPALHCADQIQVDLLFYSGQMLVELPGMWQSGGALQTSEAVPYERICGTYENHVRETYERICGCVVLQ